MLARRDRAAADLRRKLLDRGYASDVIAGVVAQLVAEKLVDDRRYVENFIAYRAARGQGPLRIRTDLRQSGVTGDLVEAGVTSYREWLDGLRAARQKKFGAKLPTDYADRQRQARFLAYRGFTGAQIRAALGIDIDSEIDADTSNSYET
jgi:regulatory protein